jgi:hypothetical protein
MVSPLMPGTKVMVAFPGSARAFATAWRREPGPESFAVVTT